MDGILNLKNDSFMTEHWQDKLGMNIDPPVLRFKSVCSFWDSLSGQLCEAILIKEQGNLNRKQKYANNELIQLETNIYSWDKESMQAEEGKTKRQLQENVDSFSKMLYNVKQKEQLRMSLINLVNCCRLKQAETSPISSDIKLKKRRMETSTPVTYGRQPAAFNMSLVHVAGQ